VAMARSMWLPLQALVALLVLSELRFCGAVRRRTFASSSSVKEAHHDLQLEETRHHDAEVAELRYNLFQFLRFDMGPLAHGSAMSRMSATSPISIVRKEFPCDGFMISDPHCR